MSHNCLNCGKETREKYCSRNCYHIHSRKGHSKNCPICNRSFFVPPSNADRIYCSRACYEASRDRTMVTKTCPVCKREFPVMAKYASRYTVCSLACRRANTVYIICERCGRLFTGKRGQVRRFCSEVCRRPAILFICERCGKKFRDVPVHKNIRRFCSFSCYRKFRGQTSIEIAVEKALSDLGLGFESEKQIGRYSVDFFIPSLNLCLEVDGAYWHRDAVKDVRKDKFLEGQGYRVKRLKEIDIMNAGNLEQFVFFSL